MVQKFSSFLLILLLLFLLAGCNTGSIHKLTWETFPKKHKKALVEMYVGEISQPHREIAIINSPFYPDQTDQTKVEMLEDLRRLARRVGADAVMDIHMLPKRFEGMVMDDRVPFPAWKQGEYDAFFLRGKAVVFEQESSVQN